MLVPDTSALTAATPKQISISGSAFSTGAVVYTVPIEKTFTGHLYGPSFNSSSSIVVNDQTIQLSNGQQSAAVVIPLTLIAGTVVKNPGSGTSYWLIGVEE